MIRVLLEFCEGLYGVLGPVRPELQWMQRAAIVLLLIAIAAFGLFIVGLVNRSPTPYVVVCSAISSLSSLIAGLLGRALQR